MSKAATSAALALNVPELVPCLTLAADTGRLPPYDGVSAEALARAGQLLARHPAISLHDHPVRLPDPLTPEAGFIDAVVDTVTAPPPAPIRAGNR